MTVRRFGLYVLVLAQGACSEEEETPTEVPCDVWYADVDGDGYGDPNTPIEVCTPEQDTSRLVENAADCDDLEPFVNPDGEEVCDLAQFDEDCDGGANDEDPDFVGDIPTWEDVDGDGYGDSSVDPELYCEVPEGRSALGGDCNDSDPNTFTGVAFFENSQICMTDADGDGFGVDRLGDQSPAPGASGGATAMMPIQRSSPSPRKCSMMASIRTVWAVPTGFSRMISTIEMVRCPTSFPI